MLFSLSHFSLQPLPAMVSTHRQLPTQASQQDLHSALETNFIDPAKECTMSSLAMAVAPPNPVDCQNMKPQPVFLAPFQQQGFSTHERLVPGRGWCAADLPLAQSCLPRDGSHCNVDSVSSCSTTWCTLPEASTACFLPQASHMLASKIAPAQDLTRPSDHKVLSSPPTNEGATLVQVHSNQASIVPVAGHEVGIQTLNVQTIATQTEQSFLNIVTNDDGQRRCWLPSTSPPGQEELTTVASTMSTCSTKKPHHQDIPINLSPKVASADEEFEMVSALLNDSELQEELIAQVWDSSQPEASIPSYQLFSDEDSRSSGSLPSMDSDVDREDTLLEDLFFIQ